MGYVMWTTPRGQPFWNFPDGTYSLKSLEMSSVMSMLSVISFLRLWRLSSALAWWSISKATEKAPRLHKATWGVVDLKAAQWEPQNILKTKNTHTTEQRTGRETWDALGVLLIKSITGSRMACIVEDLYSQLGTQVIKGRDGTRRDTFIQ